MSIKHKKCALSIRQHTFFVDIYSLSEQIPYRISSATEAPAIRPKVTAAL